MRYVDVRSDSVSRPSARMLDAIMGAASGPQALSPDDDVHTSRLELQAAGMLGKEAAMFCPTGTIANQIAAHAHGAQGRSILAPADSHLTLSEYGAASVLTGASISPVHWSPEKSALEAYLRALREAERTTLKPALMWVENTHVRSGGTVMPYTDMQAVFHLSREVELPMHLDGSRLFHAAHALRVPASELCKEADSVTLSLNKYLAAPFGAVLLGDEVFIKRAHEVRNLFGAGLRNASVAAAAACAGLQEMPDKIPETHALTKALAEHLATIPGIVIDLGRVQTNIILLEVTRRSWSTAALISSLQPKGIFTMNYNGKLRMVLWHGISSEDTAYIANTIEACLKQAPEAEYQA